MEKLNKANELAAKIALLESKIIVLTRALQTVSTPDTKNLESIINLALDLEMEVEPLIHALIDGFKVDIEAHKEDLERKEQELENMFK